MKRLYVIPLGTVEVDVSKFMAWEPERGERYSGPVAAFLIQTDDGKNVLVDTGLSPDHIDDPECRIPKPDVVVEMAPEDDIRHQLSLIGVRPEDVDIVVITHFDFDHAGGNRFFPGAEFVVQGEQYEYAKATPQRCFAQDWDLPELNYRLIHGDQELLPGIDLVTTPGHAPGHQSLIVRGLPNTGTVILSSDAAHSHVEFEEERRDPNQDDETAETMLASIRKLKRIRDAENATLLLNHDADHWSTEYRLLPDFYG
jgi:N-acyl homoserine lactone hydrolase